jgi:hypothetical protein
MVFLWIINPSTISRSASFQHGITDHIQGHMRRSKVTPPPPNKLIAFIPKMFLTTLLQSASLSLTILISSFSRMVTSIRAAVFHSGGELGDGGNEGDGGLDA